MRLATQPHRCTTFHRWKSVAQLGGLGCGSVPAAALTAGPPPGAGEFVLLFAMLRLAREHLNRAPAAEPRCSVWSGRRCGLKCWLGNIHRSETSHLADLPATLRMACGHGSLVAVHPGWTLPTQPPPGDAGSPCGPLLGLTGPRHGGIPLLSSLPASCTAVPLTHLFHSP